MHAPALDASAFNSFAYTSPERYPAVVTATQSGPGTPPAEATAEVAAWRALAASHAIVTCALDRELGERHGLGVSDFEVLERLVESADHKFRVQELADAV